MCETAQLPKISPKASTAPASSDCSEVRPEDPQAPHMPFWWRDLRSAADAQCYPGPHHEGYRGCSKGVVQIPCCIEARCSSLFLSRSRHWRMNCTVSDGWSHIGK